MSGSIPRDFSLKKAVLSGIGFFAALMMLLAMCYTLVVTEYYYGLISISENGFTMLKFSSDLISKSYQWGAILIGLICLLQLLASLALIVGNILSFLLVPKKINKVITIVSVAANAFFSFLYMLEGIIFAMICNDTMSGDFITFAYIPFIFAVLIIAAYFVCAALIKEKNEEKVNPVMYGSYPYDSITGQPLSQQPLSQQAAAGASEGETAEGAAKGGMPPEKADMLLMNFRNFIPEEKIPAFRNALGRANENCYTALSMAPLKNPMTVLLFSIFLGGLGVDRFYIGDTGMGVGKLLLGGLTFGIWPLVDIFLCYKKAKEQNFVLLMRALRMPTM